jgi:outer membrane protein assembly factor BamB
MNSSPFPRFLLAATVAVVGTVSSLQAADWPSWRGADRTDHSPDKGLLKQWPASGPKTTWVFNEAGLGYSGYSIVAGKLYTMGLRGDTEFLIAVDVKTGKQLWSAAIGPILRNGWGDGPRATPTVDGDKVYAMSGMGFLVCVGAKDGKEVWKARMTELGGKVPNWGYTESVLVDGDLVFATPGGPQGTLVAFNKATGKKAWQSAEWTDFAHYSSPIAINHNGARQIVQLTMTAVAGVDAKTGKVLWKADWDGKTAVIPTPIFKDGHVYVTSGYGIGCMLVKVGAGNKVEQVYKNKNMINHHGGVILVGNHLYGYSDQGGWTCQDFKTGEVVWAERGKLGKGAIHYADGMLYCLDEKDGTLALIEATPKGWNEKGRFKLSPQTTQRNPKGKVWTHPVVLDGKLYLRDQEYIVCYDVKGTGA